MQFPSSSSSTSFCSGNFAAGLRSSSNLGLATAAAGNGLSVEIFLFRDVVDVTGSGCIIKSEGSGRLAAASTGEGDWRSEFVPKGDGDRNSNAGISSRMLENDPDDSTELVIEVSLVSKENGPPPGIVVELK
mmetsp:Transcript_28857/g.40800  ORF Transcript_28857/g.40800 Transcript_28857/m.40800 type:complete len:132 (+) Transcript_28857:1920-2315(+)